jgi:RND family efflux transporter MFP subunit
MIGSLKYAVRSTQYLVLTVALSLHSFLAGCQPAAVAQPKVGAGAAGLEVVMAGQPTRKPLELTTVQPARIDPLEQAPIHSKIAAYVGQVLVDFGDEVKKDQPLLKLLAPELDAAVAQHRALLEQAKAQLVQAEAGARAAEAMIATAQSRVAEAEARIDRAQTDIVRWRSEFARIGQLASSGSVNRQLVDETQQKLGAAEASLKEATSAIDAAKAVVQQVQAEAAKAASDVEAARANVKVAEANLHQAQAEHSYLTISAPFTGVVTLRQVDPGHFVQPAGGGVAPLLVVARHDALRAFVAVPEVLAGFVDVGDPVLLDVAALQDGEYNAKITRTSFALDPSSRSLTAIIDLHDPQGRLRPGLYATAKITLVQRPNVLTLPAAAVVRRGKDAFCFRLVGGKAVETPLQVGIKANDEFEITGGVGENDTVILNKASSLKNGQSVEVLKQEAKK